MAENEVLIVGAGPVGLIAALQLQRYQVPFRIIDKNPTGIKDSRAAAIHARSLEMLEDLGVLGDFLKEGIHISGVVMHSQKTKLMQVPYKEIDTPYCFILDIPQSHTEKILTKHLENKGNSIDRGVELTKIQSEGPCVSVELQKDDSVSEEKYAYVIAADGARSTIRSLTKMDFPGTEYTGNWLICDAKVGAYFDNKNMHMVSHPDGIMGFFHLPDERMRILAEMKQQKPKLSENLMQSIVQERVSPDVHLEDIADLGSFIMHHRRVKHYKKDQIFFVGDAAHLHSPAGGQGMNTGMQDAYNLGWKLGYVLNNKSPEKILDSYEQERKPVADDVLKISDRMITMATLKSPVLKSIRNFALKCINQVPAIKQKLVNNFSEIYILYKKSNLLINQADKKISDVLHLGQSIPDHVFPDTKERLFSLLQGTHYTLLLFSSEKLSQEEQKELMDVYDLAKEHADIHPYIISRKKDLENALFDKEPSMHKHFSIQCPCAILVRPDRFIGFVQAPINKNNFQKALSTIFS